MKKNNSPLIVDRKTKRFWVLVEPKDGTMYASAVSRESSVDPNGDYEVILFTGLKSAQREAAAEKLRNDVDAVPVEVEIRAVETQGRKR
jgi:hypothetical protein